MDYVVGSVAALVTGNVTPSRPRTLKRALTPTKHQPSPNVTPRSEVMNDRSIFLSPSVQKKKAIVKKSPKRIFQNPDLDTTEDGDGSSNLLSPKADKVKKHLKDELDSEVNGNSNPKSPKNKDINKKETSSLDGNVFAAMEQSSNECTPKKKKNKKNSSTTSAHVQIPTTETSESVSMEVDGSKTKTSKKKKNVHKSVNDGDNKENDSHDMEGEASVSENKKGVYNSESVNVNEEKVMETSSPKKKNKKRKKKSKRIVETKEESMENNDTTVLKTPTENHTAIVKNEEKNQSKNKKKNRKRKKSKSHQPKQDATEMNEPISENNEVDASNIKPKKSKLTVNPNAITDKESDSEHESDNEIESENEGINKKVFESQTTVDESSDEEESKATKEEPKKVKAKIKEAKENGENNVDDDIKKTLFVGNVPFSSKCKKEIKKIFSKHGQIETIRIRTVPVKDGRYTPKLAVIKNELHPERTTVNIYIKYADENSVEKALTENNTVMNEHHLRVSRSTQTGVEHDPKCSIFVGNLPFALEDETLRQKFENCGEIESVRIIRDKKTNAGKGFGYVNFASKDGVELALALTEEDLTIKNRIIRVKRCTQTTNKQKQNVDKGGFKKSFNQKPYAGNQRSNSGNQRQNSGYQKPNPGNQRVQTGQRQSNNQGGYRGRPRGPNNELGQDGAHRRIMHKRKSQEVSGDGPPNKKQKDSNQPKGEKKMKKEFVGMTAEKKKKRKFDKGQKKKKNLSEILTK